MANPSRWLVPDPAGAFAAAVGLHGPIQRLSRPGLEYDGT